MFISCKSLSLLAFIPFYKWMRPSFATDFLKFANYDKSIFLHIFHSLLYLYSWLEKLHLPFLKKICNRFPNRQQPFPINNL